MKINDVFDYIDNNPNDIDYILNEIPDDSIMEYAEDNFILDQLIDKHDLIYSSNIYDIEPSLEYSEYVIEPKTMPEESVITLFKEVLKKIDPETIEQALKNIST